MDNNEQMDGKFSTTFFFRKFFHRYFWIGLIILLTAVIISNYKVEKNIFLKIFIETYQTIGIAVIVAAIFTYASGTSEFIEQIRKLLEDIIVKRNFLRNIDFDSKMDALRSLVKPSTKQKNIYSNIESYYDFYLAQTMGISKKCVRSNYHINCRAYVDHQLNKIAIDSTYSYRIYRTHEGFEKITVGFQEQEHDSFVHYISINAPDGKRERLDKDKIELISELKGGENDRIAHIDIDEIGKGHDRLDIELKITEYGYDHWNLIKFKALQPTDGFQFHLHCDDDIGIREHCVFVVGSTYFVDKDSKNQLSISCNQWINEGSGLTVLVAIPCEYDLTEISSDGVCKVLPMRA